VNPFVSGISVIAITVAALMLQFSGVVVTNPALASDADKSQLVSGFLKNYIHLIRIRTQERGNPRNMPVCHRI